MKLEVNCKKKSGKFTNLGRINSMLLNNQWVKEETKINLKNTLREMKRQHTKIYEVPHKIILKGKFLAINAYIKKQEES